MSFLSLISFPLLLSCGTDGSQQSVADKYRWEPGGTDSLHFSG